MTDSVSDLIIRLKNAYLARHDAMTLPATKLRENIVKVLVEAGYVTGYERQAQQPQDVLTLTLRYVNGKPSLTNVRRVSKPGRRWYVTADKLPRILGGYGAAVISTSQGVMTDKEARQKNLGGEVLFEIW